MIAVRKAGHFSRPRWAPRFAARHRLAPLLALALLVLASAFHSASAATDPARPAQATVLQAVYAADAGHNIANLRVGEGADASAAAFLDFYRRTGGFARWGSPRSEVHWDASDVLVQVFANGILEARPLAADPAQRGVTRRLAWDFLGGGLGSSVDLGTEPDVISTQPGLDLGPWGHRVSNQALDGTSIGFLDVFRALGGTADFGLPKTEARADTNEPGTLFLPGAKRGVIRQYFQAAVLEFEPGGTPPVVIRPLGDTLRDRDFPSETWRHLAAFARAERVNAGDRAELELLRRPPPADTSVQGLFEYALPSVARVAGNGGCGSGFFIDRVGHLVTNQHVVADAQRVTVILADGRRMFGWVGDTNLTHDLAVVRVPGLASVPLAWGDSAALSSGARLTVMGFPATIVGNQLDCPLDPVVTSGLLTAKVDFFGLPHLQTDGTVNPGSSGGPVLDTGGNVVGITVSQLVVAQNTSFLIPSERARPHIDEMLRRLDQGFQFESAEQLVQSFARQQAAIRGVAWSPDGSRVASASDDWTVAISELASGLSDPVLFGHDGPVRSVAWSPAGDQLVSGSADQLVAIWSAVGDLQLVLVGHSDVVRSVAWSPASALVASGSDDETVIIWDATSGEPTLAVSDASGAVLAVAWSPDGGKVASGTDAGLITIWDAATGDATITLREKPFPIKTLTWSPGGALLAAGDADGAVRLWNPATGEVVLTIPGHAGQITGLTWSPAGGQIASSSTDGTVKVWDVESGKLVEQLSNFLGLILSVAWSPDGAFVAGGLDSGTVRVWSAP